MALRDPVLSVHHVNGFKYELSGLRTGSVRDQMLRAQLLVERLHADAQISDTRPLLVVGAGAAGVISALTACALGVPTSLIEREKRAFQTQFGVASRRLDPTEFDWPQPHWNRGSFSAGSSPAVLNYTTDDASTLAFAWSKIYDDVRSGAIALPGRLQHIQHDARSLSYLDVSHGVAVVPWPGHPHHTEIFGAAISCIGFQGERRTVASTVGANFRLASLPFWGTDEIETGDFGIDPPLALTRIFISGGGDGAQQDFLRALTGAFGKPLLKQLGLDHLEDNYSLYGVLTAEDFAKRAGAWATAQPSPDVLHAWHAPYEALAEHIWANWQATGKVNTLVKAVLRPGVQATWLVGGESPSYCYGLNRLLTLLVARLHAYDARRGLSASRVQGDVISNEVILYGFRLKDVTPQDSKSHTCGVRCYGHPHWANVELDIGQAAIGPYEIFIIRHGVDQRPLFGLPVLSEQQVPYAHPG